MTPSSFASPRPDWTPAQKERLALAIEGVAGTVDRLGHRLDPGIVQAVAMLNALGVTTSASCEGHVDWATGGPYIDLVSPTYWAMRPQRAAALADPALAHEADRIRDAMKVANAIEGRKILPILDAFYQSRPTSYEQRIGLTFYGAGITRLESVGVAFLGAQDDPAIKLDLLRKFQSEMSDFSDFLVAYEPTSTLAVGPESSPPRDNPSSYGAPGWP